MKFKLDKSAFEDVFPPNQGALETLNVHIESSVERSIEKVIYQMKLWDQKLFNLRSEINITQVYRRLGTMVTEKRLVQRTAELHDYILQVEGQLTVNSDKDRKVAAELDELKRRFLVIFDRQQEVIIGKRNVNCLSCSEQPHNDFTVADDQKVYKGRPERAKTPNEFNNCSLLQMRWDHLGLESAYKQAEPSLTEIHGEGPVRFDTTYDPHSLRATLVQCKAGKRKADFKTKAKIIRTNVARIAQTPVLLAHCPETDYREGGLAPDGSAQRAVLSCFGRSSLESNK